MCKTVEDSVQSGLLSYVTGAFLIAKGGAYAWLGAFVITVGSMQWVDAFLWTLKQHSMPTKEVSKFGVLAILLLEPLVAYLGSLYFVPRNLVYELAYGGIMLYFSYVWIKNCEETTITKDGYLKWCDLDFGSPLRRSLFLALLFFPFFSLLPSLRPLSLFLALSFSLPHPLPLISPSLFNPPPPP